MNDMRLLNAGIALSLIGIIILVGVWAQLYKPEPPLEQVVWSQSERCQIIWGKSCEAP